MGFESAVRRGHPILFGVLVLWSFIELVMSYVARYLVGVFNDDGYPSTSVRDKLRFILFASIWTFVFSIAYIVFFVTAAGSFLASIASHLGFLALTWLFWLAGAAAITAAYDGGLNCGDYEFGHCTTQNAVEGFAWLIFLTVTLAVAVVGFAGVRSSRQGSGGFSGGLVDR